MSDQTREDDANLTLAEVIDLGSAEHAKEKAGLDSEGAGSGSDLPVMPTAVDDPLLVTHPDSPKLDSAEAADRPDEVVEAIEDAIKHHDIPHIGGLG